MRAKSSTDSQKTRATACFKLIKEAKCIGEDLKVLQPKFNNIVDWFLKKVCKGNQDIFNKWQLLIAGIDNCTHWLPKMRSNMDLWLQNPPGKCKGNWAQDSRRILSYITVCGYDTTHLQENPQRLGWGSWKDVLHYILVLHSGSLWSELY